MKKNGKKKIELDEITKLSKKLFHAYFSGDSESWFSRLCSESIYLGTNEPILFGAETIKRHFEKQYTGHTADIIQEEYFPVSLSDDNAQVCGQIIVQSKNSPYRAITYFSIGYKLVDKELKIVHQHNSFQFLQTEKGLTDKPLNNNLVTTRFVRDLLLDRYGEKRLQLRYGGENIFINPSTVLYFQSQRKQTETVCLDRIIACTCPIGELAETLPPNFLFIHRRYIVNTQYIVAIRRFEVELISGICIPIPAANYMAVKEKIQEML